MADYFLPQLQNLEGALNNFGNIQRSDAQTSLANARAQQQLDLAKQAADLQAKRFSFETSQYNQQRAMEAFKQGVNAYAQVNPAIANGLLDAVSGVQNGDPQAMQMLTGNPVLLNAAKTVYGKLNPDDRNALPSSFNEIFGGQPANVNQAKGPANAQSESLRYVNPNAFASFYKNLDTYNRGEKEINSGAVTIDPLQAATMTPEERNQFYEPGNPNFKMLPFSSPFSLDNVPEVFGPSSSSLVGKMPFTLQPQDQIAAQQKLMQLRMMQKVGGALSPQDQEYINYVDQVLPSIDKWQTPQ